MAVYKSIYQELLSVTNVAGSGQTSAIDATGAVTFGAQCVVTVTTPIPKTFLASAVVVATDIITLVAHGYGTGLKVQISNPGTLPAGISAVTDYFCIKLSADTFALATSLALAQAGTKLDITSQGVGTNTVTATALAGATVKLQKSNDNVNWADEGSATSITASGVIWLEKANPTALYLRISYVTTAGQVSADNTVLIKGPN